MNADERRLKTDCLSALICVYLRLVMGSVAVGTPVYPTPPAQIRTCRIAAYGSYLRYLASKRMLGCGCRIFALGIHRSTNGQNRSQVIRVRWLRRRSARYQRQIT